ncbi:hypothetical protein ACYPKM_00675 [Pseudomonas aeruginosa]
MSKNTDEQQIAKYQEEARRLAGEVTANQRRWLEIGLTKGKTMEPAGILAGTRNTKL